MKRNDLSIKVLHLLSSTALFGAENVVMELLKQLRTSKIKTFLGILENTSNAHLIIADKARKYIPDVKIFSCNGKFDIKTILHMRRFLEINNINIIHSHKYKTNFYSLIASAPKKTLHVATCHNWLGENTKMKMYEWLDKRILKKFDRIIAVSEEVKEKLLRASIPPYKVLKIKNGISLERYSTQHEREVVRSELRVGENKIVIGMVGRLDKNKGVSYLLSAAKLIIEEFANVVFLIVGDGASRQELHDETLKLGIGESVIFTGLRNDIPSILSAMDIFVLPSLKEGLPMVLLEAMASKKPVIATRVGDIPNVITHNESGWLVEPGNTKQLRNTMRYLINDRNHLSLVAEKGYQKVKNIYSSKQMAAHYIEVYKDVLSSRKGAAA